MLAAEASMNSVLQRVSKLIQERHAGEKKEEKKLKRRPVWGPYEAVIFVSQSGSFSWDTSGYIPVGKNSKADFQVWPS